MAAEQERKYANLPPPEVRLYDPLSEPDLPKIPTPLDSQGLVDIPRLLDEVKATIDPSYEWPRKLKVHHFFWPDAAYPYDLIPNVSAGYFRNLPIHKGLVIRSFEEWLHEVTDPPPVPSLEIIQNRVEAWAVAKDLFKMSRKTIQWQRLARRRRELIALNPDIIDPDFNGVDIIGEEIMAEIFDNNFEGLNYQLERNEKVPAEHRLVELNQPPDEIAKRLGKLIIPSSLNLVPRILAA